jgi:hypothetical protein
VIRRSRGKPERVKIIAAIGAVLLGVTGCGAPAQRVHAAEAVAVAFLRAYQAGDGEGACELIAPQTRSEVERQEQKPCPAAILAQQLPALGQVRRTEVYVQQGVVVTTQQTVFLTEFALGWRVTAAGCRTRGHRPTDCEVQGA